MSRRSTEELSIEEKELIFGKAFYKSHFFSKLAEYYLGHDVGKPTSQDLVRDLNDDIIPYYFKFDRWEDLKHLVTFYDSSLERAILLKKLSEAIIYSFEYLDSGEASIDLFPDEIVQLAIKDAQLLHAIQKRLGNDIFHVLINQDLEESGTFGGLIQSVGRNPRQLKYKKSSPEILDNIELAFNIEIDIDLLFDFVQLFKSAGIKYITPVKMKPGSYTQLMIGYTHKYLETSLDRSSKKWQKNHTVATSTNVIQGYKSFTKKCFSNCLAIDSFLALGNPGNMNDLLSNFKLLTYVNKLYIPSKSESHISDYEYDWSSEYDQWTRDAYEDNPDLQWNND